MIAGYGSLEFTANKKTCFYLFLVKKGFYSLLLLVKSSEVLSTDNLFFQPVHGYFNLAVFSLFRCPVGLFWALRTS